MTGSLDNIKSMNVNGTVETITLTLSPAIVRLMIHAIKRLAPKKVIKLYDSHVMHMWSKERPLPPPAPQDLWNKKSLINSKLWYLLPGMYYQCVCVQYNMLVVPLHNTRSSVHYDGDDCITDLDETVSVM